jgi:hypothetical protein
MSASAAETAIEREAIAIHQDLDVLCRGGSGDADEACAIRLHAEKLLGLLGYCYGTKADFGLGGGGRASAVWHKDNGNCAHGLEPMDLAMGGLDETHSELYCALIILHHNDPRIRPDCRT